MKNLIFFVLVIVGLNLSAQNHTITLKRGSDVVGSYGDISSSGAENGAALIAAINVAVAGDSLLLKGKQGSFDGIYVGATTYLITKKIVIKGVGGNAILKPGSEIATISNRVMQVNVGGVSLINLTITGGNLLNGSGAGVYMTKGGSTFRDCLFVDNQVESNGTGATWGGALCIPAGQERTFVENCQFINNAAWGNKSNPTAGLGYGGAVAVMGKASPMTFTNCLFANNFAKTYGGALASGSGLVTEDNLQFINCTVVNNKIAAATNSAALNPASGAGMTVINTVIYGNMGGAGQLVSGTGSKYINCAYQGAILQSAAKLTNCIKLGTDLSLFTKPTAEAGFNPTGAVAYNEADWSLSTVSCLINRGQDISSTLAKDIVGNPRKQVGFVDLGVYESAAKGNIIELSVTPAEAKMFLGQKFPDFSITASPEFPIFEAEFSGFPKNSNTVGQYTITATLKSSDLLYWNVPATINSATLTIEKPAPITSVEQETPIFIVMGQSNADGSAMTDAAEDARLAAWYDDPQKNPGLMKIWYRSCYTTKVDGKGNCATDGTTKDMPDGWMDLYYKNDNLNGRTSMVGVTGTWTEHAATMRRGMEGEFGMKFQENYPSKELCVLKLGISGSNVDTWNATGSNHNWDYFFQNIYKPAVNDLLSQGKKPRLAGIWWMQGEAESAMDKATYEKKLNQFISQSRDSLGFAEAPVYVGYIVKPGENTAFPLASTQFGQGVRDAQDNVAAKDTNVYIVDTRQCPFGADNLHYSHVGVNQIGDKIAQEIIAKGVNGWAAYKTPGKWENLNQQPGEKIVPVTFVPIIGTPEKQSVKYFVNNSWVETVPTEVGTYDVKVTLEYATWSEEVTSKLIIKKLAEDYTILLKRGTEVIKTYGNITSTAAENGNAFAQAMIEALSADSLLLKGAQEGFDGVYAGNFTVGKKLIIKGLGKTTLKPASEIATTSNRVMQVSGENAVLINLTITGGKLLNAHGAGIYLNVGGTTIKDCIFIDNQTVSDGTAAVWGGAICIPAGKTIRTIVENCQFINNAAWGNKDNELQTGNERGFGGAVAGIGKASPMTFTNCVFANNYAKTYGAAYASGSGLDTVDNLQFINCTVANNKISSPATATCASALNPASCGGLTVVNTVIYGNVGGQAQWWRGINSKYINSACQGAPIYPTNTTGATIENSVALVTGKSLFVQPTTEAGVNPTGDISYDKADWSPSATSCLINRGAENTYTTATTDIVGNSRKQVNLVDIGAYESDKKGNVELTVTPSEANIFVGQKIPAFSIATYPDRPVIESELVGVPANSNTLGETEITAKFKSENDSWSPVVNVATLKITKPIPLTSIEEETPIFIVLGQSNADGTGQAEPAEDAKLAPWFDDPKQNPGLMKIWYNSCNGLGIDGKLGPCAVDATPEQADAPNGWMDLYYKNDNINGKTSMVGINATGTWSVYAANRRGMEGSFGMNFQKQYPNKELYVLKLGVSGSYIDSWSANGSNHNWEYFFEKIYKPAINDLIYKGKKPRLAGIWWMQGESDKAMDQEAYETQLKQFISQTRDSLGFAKAPVYVGYIVKPGENPAYPLASTHYGQGVRDAQNKVAESDEDVFIVDTRDCPFYSDNLHFSNAGVNKIGSKLSEEVAAKGVGSWAVYQTPGKWNNLEQKDNAIVAVTFSPSLGTPAHQSISYCIDGKWGEDLPKKVGIYDVRVVLNFETWSDTITNKLTITSSVGIHEMGTEDVVNISVQGNQIIITNKSDEQLDLAIYNAVGQKVMQLNVTDYQTIIPTSRFTSGVYIVALDGMINKNRIKIVVP